MARERRHRRNRRSNHRFSGIYIALTAIIIVFMVVGGSIVFFKVNNFDLRLRTPTGNIVCLQGNSRYTEEEIIEACGTSTGANLCLVKKTSVANNLLRRLSYVSGVNVTRRLPGTLVITISESRSAACIRSGESYFIVDAKGKLLEESLEPIEGCPLVTGLTLREPQVGQVIQVYEEAVEGFYDGGSQLLQREALLHLLSALEGRELTAEITSIELDSDSEVRVVYQNRLRTLMKLDADFDYQVKLLNSVLEDYIALNWSEKDSGTLDMTYEDGQTHLIRDTKKKK